MVTPALVYHNVIYNFLRRWIVYPQPARREIFKRLQMVARPGIFRNFFGVSRRTYFAFVRCQEYY